MATSNKPYADQMRIDQSSMEIAGLVHKIEQNEIDLQPDFQRGQVWSLSKKQRLIDTILREWYVPAIHLVVNDDLNREEVLDGQQRLQSILEFLRDEFPVDGKISPHDPYISSLHGLTFSQLPLKVQSRFRRYSLTTVRLRNYETQEPGELFFRLNQLTSLTAAEQRNALIGEPRNQIKRLAELVEDIFSTHAIGFSNARMNYDDVLCRLAYVLERGRLDEKMTSNILERRYREQRGFPQEVIEKIHASIFTLAHCFTKEFHSRQNKATFFSWLFYACDSEWVDESFGEHLFPDFFRMFETLRMRTSRFYDVEEHLVVRQTETEGTDPVIVEALDFFADRSSSRVNDVTSVLLRDLCLHVSFYRFVKGSVVQPPLLASEVELLEQVSDDLSRVPDDVAERAMLEYELAQRWGEYRAAGRPR